MLESTLPDIKFSLQKDNGALSNFSGDRSEIKMKSFSVSKASEAKNTSDSAFGSIQKSVDSKGNQKSGRSGGKSKRSPRKEKKNDQSRQTFGDLKAQAKAQKLENDSQILAGETDGKEEKTKQKSQRKKEKNKELRADVI